jgi:hypothetical protein
VRRGDARPIKARDGRRRDDNEPAIVTALEQCGASVTLLSIKGGPDLLVGFRRRTYLVEVKSDSGTLTPAQRDYHASWRGDPIRIVRSPDDALRLIGVHSAKGGRT